MTRLTARSVLRRFLVLAALRWLPVGLLIPIYVLLPLSRGLSLGEIGLAMAAQGIVVVALELPTGGLADSIGRRRVLLIAMVIGIVSTGLFMVADSFVLFVTSFALQGLYRALDSGPLEAWYVDTAQAADGDARIDVGMSAQGTVVGVVIAVGALASGGLIAWDPVRGVDALVAPVILALGLQLIGLLVAAVLMVEAPRSSGLRDVLSAAWATPRTIAEGFGLLRHSPVLLALVAVEFFWGFGMATFESLLPIRLAEVVGGTDLAAAITGPAASVAWLASAAGAAVTPWLGRWMGMAPAAALHRVLQGVTVAAMGFAAGIAGILMAYVACYAVHGSSNAAHMTLLHQQVMGRVRATVVSLNSMVSQPAGALGMITLTMIAEAVSVSTAMYVGAVVLAVAAPLYIPAWRQSLVNDAPPTPSPVSHSSI